MPGPPAQPLRTLGRLVVLLLTITILADAADVLVTLDERALLDRLIAGVDVPGPELERSDDRLAITALVQLASLILTTIVFVIWFRRAYANAPRLAAMEKRYGDGWAIGAWFVPFLNLVRPKKIANDIWRAGDPAPPAGVPFVEWPVSWLLHLWWALWLITNFVSNLASRALDAETLRDQRSLASATLAADLVDVIAAAAAIAVVVQTTRRYERRREALGA
ncbi:MAG: hypothetical protein AVDCRST_MAG30-580 [uncultured Solirubrobacteraceae bacterium]|uniref:DUF4328 domain-containing protein n=1 Tax=uncultured Solirubrobacteraceae bacterium TaxID=1162706 RepID=A0A6J4RWJ8_9ACTN|nr:MAG: hypothetical protein AVDCRST_MAG30-580 [uncultured Solirubrobacteraceae bacterium]